MTFVRNSQEDHFMARSAGTQPIQAPSSLPEQSAGVPSATQIARPARLWPALVMLAAFWTTVFVAREIELVTFVRFLSSMATSGLLVLAFTTWWFFRKGISRQDRLFGFCATLAGGVVAGFVCDKSIGIFGLIANFPDTLAKIGVHTDGVGTTPFAGAFDIRDSADFDARKLTCPRGTNLAVVLGGRRGGGVHRR